MRKQYALQAFAALALVSITLYFAGCSQSSNPVSTPNQTGANLPANITAGAAVPNHYIVVYKSGVDAESASADIASTHGLALDYKYKHAIGGFAATITGEHLQKIMNDPRVDRVEPDYIATAVQSATQQVTPWGITRVDATASKEYATGWTNGKFNGTNTNSVPGVEVYIIDTGIYPDNDLNINSTTYGGCVSYQTNALYGTQWWDDNGHGTHVSGIAAAYNDTMWVVGAAPGADLHAVKVLDNTGSGAFSTVIAGVDYVDSLKKAHKSVPMVANMSLGAQTGTAQNSLDQAVANAITDGVVFCVAAGNSGTNANGFSPAHVSAAITVAAYDNTNRLASWSNYGSIVDIGAPGVNIVSTWPNNSTQTLSGTSMATPHVTGSAALYLYKNQTASPASVCTALLNAAKNKSNPTISVGRKSSFGASGSQNLSVWDGTF